MFKVRLMIHRSQMQIVLELSVSLIDFKFTQEPTKQQSTLICSFVKCLPQNNFDKNPSVIQALE